MRSHMSTQLTVVMLHRHASEANAIPNFKAALQVSFVEKAIPECIAMNGPFSQDCDATENPGNVKKVYEKILSS